MPKPRVFLTRKWPQSVEDKLQQQFDVCLNHDDHPLTTAEISQALLDYDALCPTVTDQINADILQLKSRRCRILANYGVGFNHIDIAAAQAEQLIVTNTPDVLTDSTAEIAISLLLMSARRCAEGERLIRNDRWTGWCPTQMLSSDVTGRTLGIVGFGRIGQAVARIAHHGFGMSILYFQRNPAPTKAEQAVKAQRCNSLKALLQQADFVSLHVPGGEQSKHLIDAEMLACMPETAHLINTARGDVVDTTALIDAVRSKAIAGAGLDVFENEPNLPPELRELDNVTLLPHLGSATLKTRTAMGEKVLANLQAFFAGESPPDRVV